MAGQSYLPIEVLDYVETHAPAEESPYGISQRELAKALGYHPCSMSRPLEELVRDGYLTSKRGPVRDGIRKQIVYRLTEGGRSRLLRETKHVPLLAGALPPPPNPFLGRKDELARLAEFAQEGGAIMLVDGPPGMGKTALVSRHIRRVKRGRIPFWFAVRPASSPRQFVTALSHALSFLGAPQLAYYSQLPRGPTAREVADLTARALSDRELAVVIDDVQMAGPDLRDFLVEFVADLVRGRKDQVYLVGQEILPLDPAGVSTSRMTVGGLDRSAAHDLTDRRGGLAERFESVFQSTLGSPLLLQLAVSNPGVEADATTLPNRVVERLSIEEIRAVLPIALSNEPLPLAFVADMKSMTPARLAEVIRMGVVQKTLQGRIEILQVVRSALMARIGSDDERRAHLQLADFYSGSRRPEAVRERFLHLVEGESWKPASQLLTQQERTLLGLGYSEALRAAFRHLANALPRGSPKVRVLLGEATLLRHHSAYADAIIALRKAISESNDEPKVTCEAHLSIVDLSLRLHQLDEALKEFRQADAIGPITRRLQVFFLLSEARLIEAQGHIQDSRTKFQESFELARKYRVPDLALESIAAWSRLEEFESGPEVVVQVIAAALPEARQAGRLDIAFNLRLIRARAYFRMGQVDAAESEMKLVRAEAESLGYLNQLNYSLNGLVATAIQRERWTDAVTYAKQACSLAERLGNDLVLGHTLALLCTAELRQSWTGGSPKLLEDSIHHGERSVELLARLPPTEAIVYARSYLSEAWLYGGNREKAAQEYKLALDLCDKLNLGWLKVAIVSELGVKFEAKVLPTVDPTRVVSQPGTETVSTSAP
jgi:tetratricopeptide (TPR) repeat protein/DNA-binding MarR family transcriptional regulator